MQLIKSFTIIASLALALSACSGNELSSGGDVQLDSVGAVSLSDALTSCDSFWGWFTGNCTEEVSVQETRCTGLSNAPGRSFESPGTWDADKRACVDKWPSPICYGLFMNSCERTGTDATHACSSWNLACRAVCSKWNGMRFGGYCTSDWWTEHP